MKRFTFILIFILCMNFVHSQNPNDLPAIIPPSPEVATLSNITNISAGLHTGSATINLPLYEIMNGNLKLPICLSYSTNGVKVTDIASRVGLGWNLIAGGSVSRNILDEDDFDSNRNYLPPVDFFSVNYTSRMALLSYLNNAVGINYDTEHDAFSYSVNGVSGKFFIDSNFNCIAIEHTNHKIEKTTSGFIITTGEGIKYFFGNGNVEKTKDVKTNHIDRGNKVSSTSWFVYKISSPEGQEIHFQYESIFLKTCQGLSQTVLLRAEQPPYIDRPPGCGLCNTPELSEASQNTISYDSYYLTRIFTSNGLDAYFTYVPRLDSSHDKLLSEFKVYSSLDSASPRLIKRYKFSYRNFTNDSVSMDINQRFYLDTLYALSTEDIPLDTLKHVFEYNDPGGLPSQTSKSQDYFGYANGIYNTHFFPKPNNYENYVYGDFGANRQPDFNHGKKGTLKKVIFPTGGYKEFFYEPHTIAQDIVDSTFSVQTLNCEGVGVSSRDTVFYYHSSASSVLHVLYYTYDNPNVNAPDSGDINYWAGGDGKSISRFKIVDTLTGETISAYTHYFYKIDQFSINLIPNHVYRISLEVTGFSNKSTVTLDYDPSLSSRFENMSGCGVRVKQINSYDPVSNQILKKFYSYSTIKDVARTLQIKYDGADTLAQTDEYRSSGVGKLKAITEAFYSAGGLCERSEGEYVGTWVERCNNIIQVSSSTLSGGYTFNGSPIAYASVIESNDSLFVNGGIEHRFYTSFLPDNSFPLLGFPTSSANNDFKNDANGTELETNYFKRQADSFLIIKAEKQIYSTDSRISKFQTNYSIRKRWPVPGGGYLINFNDSLAGFDVSLYFIEASWFHLDTTIITTYDQDGENPMVEIITYTYDDSNHLQPTLVKTWNSRNQEIHTRNKYPINFSSAVYDSMVAKNIITPLIHQSKSKSGDTLSKQATIFTAWAGASSFYKPTYVQASKASHNLETRLHFYSYDSIGNPLELSKENGMHLSYIWDYKKSVPIAEVKNASQSDIAYTSFESDGKGNWSFSSAGITSGGITGNKGFTGTLTKNVSSLNSYVISLWTKSSATVNSYTGTLIVTKGDWTLYEWHISGASSITISGTDLDEVRLYPVDAQMMTYTYFPFIGVRTVNDLNNNITFYEYDGFNRLKKVRDFDKNILKSYVYKYNQGIQ